MRWVAKAALQRGLGLMPQGERVNYLFQRHVAGSLPGGEQVVRRKLARARQHLEAFGRPVEDAIFYEFGAGWDLVEDRVLDRPPEGLQVLSRPRELPPDDLLPAREAPRHVPLEE